MNVLFLIGTSTEFDTRPILFPIGPAILTSIIRAQGHRVRVRHLQLAKLTESELNEFQPDLVLMSAVNIEWQSVKNSAQIVKEWNPSIPFLLGGPIGNQAELVLDNISEIDAVVFGEGEPIILDALNPNLWDSLPGVITRSSGPKPPCKVEDLDSVPFPDFSTLAFPFYMKNYARWKLSQDPQHWFSQRFPSGRNRMGVIMGSRGCTNYCSFCYHVIPGYRYRSVPNIGREIEIQIGKYGIDHLLFLDNLLAHTPDRLHDICELMRGFGIPWTAQMRVDMLSTQTLQELKASGLSYLGVGVEAADDQMLSQLNKGIRVSQIEKVFQDCHDLGIFIYGNMIVHNPGETFDQVRTSLRWVIKHPQCNVRVVKTMCIPDSPMFRKVSSQGLIPNPVRHNQKGFEMDLSQLTKIERRLSTRMIEMLSLGMHLPSTYDTECPECGRRMVDKHPHAPCYCVTCPNCYSRHLVIRDEPAFRSLNRKYNQLRALIA